jgi:hypothetical protein
MTPEEIKALAGKWVALVRSHPGGEIDIGSGKPGWPDLPPVGPDRVEVVREILTQLGPDYAIHGGPAIGHLVVRKDHRN